MEALADFVEQMGDFFCQSGKGRIAGRLVAFLLICDPPYQSASQLAEATQASKGSISMLLRQLVQAGLIERKGLPGERKTYYRIRPGAWWHMLSEQMQELGRLRQLADQALSLLPDRPRGQSARLREMRDFYSFVHERLPSLRMEWRAIRQAGAYEDEE